MPLSLPGRKAISCSWWDQVSFTTERCLESGAIPWPHCHKSWCRPEPNSPRAGLTGLVLWEVETRNPGVMSMGALGQLWEMGEKAEVRVFRGVDPWRSGGGGPVKHGHPATHPGQCAMMGVPFSECMHLTRTHTACIYQSKISGSGWTEGAACGFFGGEVCNPEGKGLEWECF